MRKFPPDLAPEAARFKDEVPSTGSLRGIFAGASGFVASFPFAMPWGRAGPDIGDYAVDGIGTRKIDTVACQDQMPGPDGAARACACGLSLRLKFPLPQRRPQAALASARRGRAKRLAC